jgi:hypothetical protein
MSATFGEALIIQKTNTLCIWFLGATSKIKQKDKLDNLIDNIGGKENG